MHGLDTVWSVGVTAGTDVWRLHRMRVARVAAPERWRAQNTTLARETRTRTKKKPPCPGRYGLVFLRHKDKADDVVSRRAGPTERRFHPASSLATATSFSCRCAPPLVRPSLCVQRSRHAAHDLCNLRGASGLQRSQVVEWEQWGQYHSIRDTLRLALTHQLDWSLEDLDLSPSQAEYYMDQWTNRPRALRLAKMAPKILDFTHSLRTYSRAPQEESSTPA